MNAVTAGFAPPAAWAPKELSSAGKIFAFAVMCVGMFIALLDIQIVSASLKDIGGGLSAGQDETAWVQTSYLIAEIIVIPMSGWLSRVMSTRWLFCVSAAGFTATSLLCGCATGTWRTSYRWAWQVLKAWSKKATPTPLLLPCQWKRSSGDVGPAHQRLSQARNRFLERPPGSSCQPCDNQPQLRARRISDRKRCTARHPAWQRTSAARSGRVFLEVLQFLSSAQISGER